MRKKKETRPDCYKCIYRADVSGSAHSCCRHPSVAEYKNDPLSNIMAIFASVKRAEPMLATSKELNIKAKQRGIDMGWFNFPWNYDPVWLDNCDGFTTRRKDGKEAPFKCAKPVQCEDCDDRFNCYADNEVDREGRTE